MQRRILVILALILSVPAISDAQTRPRESLRGLPGVYVYVHPVEKDVEAGGLLRSQIQSAVEGALRKAGITIYSEPQPADGSANLTIVVDTIKHPQGPYLYSVEVSLLQEVHLARRREPDPFPAQTWSARAFGLTSPNRMDLILEPIRMKVDEFIGDYLAVNPKPK